MDLKVILEIVLVVLIVGACVWLRIRKKKKQ